MGNKDFFTGLGIFFDTYSNHNGVHAVSSLHHKYCLFFEGENFCYLFFKNVCVRRCL